jgi:hypothetical protein
MKRLVYIAIMALVAGICSPACADLFDRGSGIIYDSDLDITWYDYTYVDTVNDGDAWDQAVAWAAALDIGGVTGWRLPATPGTATGYVNEGEMGHLYYVGLGNTANQEASINTGPFQHLTGDTYWYGTEHDTNAAWEIHMRTGYQGYYNKINYNYRALAVHSGDVGAGAPIPGDFAPADCDIDGSDLAALIAGPGALSLTTFAHNFGKTTSVGCSL